MEEKKYSTASVSEPIAAVENCNDIFESLHSRSGSWSDETPSGKWSKRHSRRLHRECENKDAN